jgi:hypothetical protein
MQFGDLFSAIQSGHRLGHFLAENSPPSEMIPNPLTITIEVNRGALMFTEFQVSD